mgnify:CR=1 FL=1
MKDLETKRYLLRKPKIEDAEEIHEIWGTDKEKIAEYKEHDVCKNIIETRALLKTAITDSEYGRPYWLVEEKKHKKIIGYVKVPRFSRKDRKCEVAFYILKKLRMDKTPQEVLTKAIQYLFTDRGFETIIMKFYGSGVEDIKILDQVLKDIGMKRDGILRNRLIDSHGEKVDKYMYSILKEEWLQNV